LFVLIDLTEMRKLAVLLKIFAVAIMGINHVIVCFWKSFSYVSKTVAGLTINADTMAAYCLSGPTFTTLIGICFLFKQVRPRDKAHSDEDDGRCI